MIKNLIVTGVFYMDDITSRDEEKVQKEEQIRKEEQNRQQDAQKTRDQATEKGRKQGLEEERAREKAREKQKGMGTGVKVILSLIVLAIIVVIAAYATLSVSVMDVTAGSAFPFTSNYGVTFPEGQTITIGTSHIIVLSFQNEIISDIDGDRQKLVVGEDRVISERHAVITTLGVIKLLDTNFKINLKYKGNRDNVAYFDMAVLTSQQVPDILLRQLLPAEINAQPI